MERGVRRTLTLRPVRAKGSFTSSTFTLVSSVPITLDWNRTSFIEPYSGLAQIQIGLYDAVTLRRVLVADGSDAVLLPIRLQVEAKP